MALALSLILPIGAVSFAQTSENSGDKEVDYSATEKAQKPKKKDSLVATSSEDEAIFELSPFEIKASDQDIGYRQQNTLAGSRLNTNIADLGASLTIVTKEQLEDTASLDLNDILRFEASTEGSSTYTEGGITLRSDGVIDTNAGYTAGGTGVSQTNATANTVRGLGSPGASINFYRAIRQIPLDAYNVQSVSISRGPNSMLFGVGTPSGYVNQRRTAAVLNKDGYSVNVRVDDRESKRGSVSFNKGLIEDKLAFAGALLSDHKEFDRKPSYDDTERLFGTLTYKPFEGTKLSASYESFENKNNRPNSITPIDHVSEWFDAGKPVYNPSTQMVTYLSTGEEVGPFLADIDSPRIGEVRDYIESRPNYNESLWNADKTTYNGVPIVNADNAYTALSHTGSALYVPGLVAADRRATMQVANGQVVNFFEAKPAQYRTGYGFTDENGVYHPEQNALGTPEAVVLNDSTSNQFWTSSNSYSQLNSTTLAQPVYAGVTDQSIYDWTKTNILGMNYGENSGNTYNLDFEQKLSDDLYFSAGWFRQDFESLSSYTVSQINATALRVDTNVTLPNGEPNPFLGQVYVEDNSADHFLSTIENDQYRAMLAYAPDFTHNDGWTRWLGRHQLLAFASREEESNSLTRQRLMFTSGEEEEAGMIRYLSNPNAKADGTTTGYNYEGSTYRRAYYLSNPGDTHGKINVTNPGVSGNEYTGPLNVYNYEDQQWQDVAMTSQFNDFSATTKASQVVINSYNLGGTSHLWNDRIVATYGIRSDEVSTRATAGTSEIVAMDRAGNIQYDENGEKIILEDKLQSNEIWVDGRLDTDRILERFHPWKTLKDETVTSGLVFKPFSKWDAIDSRAKSGNLFAEFVSTLGFTYNKSSTFNPPTTSGIDLFGTPLPKPTGDGEDIGIQFSLFEGKLFARVSQYTSTNDNERGGLGSTIISRFRDYVDKKAFKGWCWNIAMINRGYDPVNDWKHFNNSGWSQEDLDALDDEIEELYGLPLNYYDSLNGDIGGTQSTKAEGTELQIDYNPTRNWTIKLTASKQETRHYDVLKEWDAWFNYRAEFMQKSAADVLKPEYQEYATTFKFAGIWDRDLSTFWDGFGYSNIVKEDHPWGWTSGKNLYDLLVGSNVQLAQDLNGQVVTNQSKYQASLLTNYKFSEGRLKGFSLGGSARWLDEKSIGYLGMASGVNGTKLDISDISKPLYTPAQTYVGLWFAYSRPIMDDRVDMKIQLNIDNAFESGGLQMVKADFEGNPTAYRIVDPRKFILQATFKM